MKQVLRAGETMATTTTAEMVVSTVRKIRETMVATVEAVVVEDAAEVAVAIVETPSARGFARIAEMRFVA